MESVQQKHEEVSTAMDSRTKLTSLARNTAAASSNCGTLRGENGATFDFAAIRVSMIAPVCLTVRKYTTAA